MKKSLLLTLLLLVSLVLLGSGILFFTHAGLKIGIDLAQRLVPGRFSAEAVSGRLADHFILQDLRYSGGGTTVSLDRFSFSWQPRALFTKVILIRSIAVSGMDVEIEETTSANESVAGDTSPSFVLPLAVQIDSFSLQAGGISLPGHAEPYKFDRIILERSTADEERIQFDRLMMTGPAFSIDLGGEVQTRGTLFVRLRIDYLLKPDGYGVFEGRGILTGSPAELHVTADMRQPFPGSLQGTVTDPAGELHWQASLRSDSAYLPAVNPNWPQFSFSAFGADGNGTTATYALHIDTDTEYRGYEKIHVQTDLEGNAGSLRFTDILLRREEGQLAGDGKLDWEKTFTWQADLTGKQIILSEINSEWPQLFFPEISLRGHGEQDRYSLQVKADVQHDKIREKVQVETGITGDGEGLNLQDVRITQDESRLTGEVRFDWREVFRWHAEITGNSLNPAVIDARWTGRLDTRFVTEGSLENGKADGHFNLVSLAGQLRDYPVTAHGHAAVHGDNFSLSNFFLKTTGTEVSASGLVGETVSLDFQMASADLSVIWPELGGVLRIDGRIEGNSRQPEIRMNLSGEGVSAFGNSIDTLGGKINADLSPGGRVEAAVTAAQIVIAERELDSLNVDLRGLIEDHTLQVHASGDDGLLILEMRGGFAEKIWKGEIRQTEIHAGRYGNWSLQGPCTVEAAEGMLAVNDLCMTGQQNGGICIDGRQDRAAGWLVNANITSLPLALVQNIQANSTLPPFDGSVSGKFSLAGTGSEIQSGELALSTENASLLVELAEDEHHEIIWHENTLHADLTGNRLTVDMQSILRDGSTVAASFILDEFSPFAPQMDRMMIQGTVSVNILELRPLSALTFPLVEPGGNLAGNFTLSGSVTHPRIKGQAELVDGKMIIPKLGITVEDLKMAVEGNERLVNLQASGRSGGGSIQADGELAMETGRADTLQVRISGEEFETVHLPELVLHVTPQLNMKLSRREGEVKGSLRITEGIIAPTTLAGSLAPSRDVVFVHADKTGTMEDEWPFSAIISVIIGDQVEVDAFGLKGRINGEIQVTDLPRKIATGTGSLDVVDGTFAIYGRELLIKKGQLLFSGGPIDNPGISVRAEHTTKDVTTGIAVSGFLREPEITFYSEPPMEENEIISRLLMNTSLVGSSEKDSGFIGSVAAKTGLDPLTSTFRDVKDTLRVDDVKVETGKTSEDLSLVIGTWLTPSLYVSYGKNLLKESGSFNTRYLLGHGFSVETETGATESGGDLKYEIGR